MNRRKKVMELFRIPALLLVLSLALAGCGGSGGEESETGTGQKTDGSVNVAEIKKDGVITNTTEEAFEPELYGDEDALKEFVLRTAAACNEALGEEQVSVKKLEVKKDRVTLVMEYGSAEAFGTFHDFPFFCGTVAEAYEQGYDLDVELYEAGAGEGAGSSIGREELLEMGSRRIVIAQILPQDHLTIQTSGKILYIRGAEYVKSNTAYIPVSEEDTREIAYIIYK